MSDTTVSTALIVANQSVLAKLMDEGVSASTVIPDDIKPDQFWEYVTVACEFGNRLNMASMRLRPIIGRIMLLARNNPPLYVDRGFKNFGDFVERGMCEPLGLSPTVVRDAMRIAGAFPSLSPDRFESIGINKLLLLEQTTNDSMRACEDRLKLAETLTFNELEKISEEQWHAPAGSTRKTAIKIFTSQDVLDNWNQFAGSPEVHGVVGSADHGKILSAAIAEASSAWIGGGSPSGLSALAVEKIKEFVTNHNVHTACGSTDSDTIILWALADCLAYIK